MCEVCEKGSVYKGVVFLQVVCIQGVCVRVFKGCEGVRVCVRVYTQGV